MSMQRTVFVFLFGLLLVFSSGCGSGGKSSGDGAGQGNGDGSKDSAPAVSASVWLDNCRPQNCAVAVDGESKGTLEPFASQFLEIASGTHTFTLTCEGQAAEIIQSDLPGGKTTLIRPAGSDAYLLLTRTYGASAESADVQPTPAPKTGVITADYGPLAAFPDVLPGGGKSDATRTRIVRALPADADLAQLEHFISDDFRVYGIADAQHHREAVLAQLKRLEPRAKEPAVGDLLIRVADHLSVCAAANSDQVAVSDAVLTLLTSQQERIPDDKLIAWLGLDAQTGKARVLPEGQQVNPAIAAASVALLLQRGKQQQVLDAFPALPPEAACGVLAKLAFAPASDELRRRAVVLGLGRTEDTVLKEACKAIADKEFVPDEEMVEALTSTIGRLDPNNPNDRATIAHCSSCLVDAFYRHPAVVARPKTRSFLVRFADPQLEPTLENARNALIDGRCAGDLVPIYTHFARDPRIDMVGHLVSASQKRGAVGQDAIELERVSLADEDTEVRLTAAKAMSQLCAFLTRENLPAFQDLMVRALSDPSWDVQREAARALEVDGFVPTEQIADQLVAACRQLDKNDPQGKANRDQMVKSLKTCFEKNPGVEADKAWRERTLKALDP